MPTEQKVRKHVTSAVRKANLTTVTPKQIRRTIEKQLSLEQDFLAAEKWKTLVNDVIEETMAAIERDEPTTTNNADSDHAMDAEESEEAIKRTLMGGRADDSEEAETDGDSGYTDNVSRKTKSRKEESAVRVTISQTVCDGDKVTKVTDAKEAEDD